MKMYLVYCLENSEDKSVANQLETLAEKGLKAINITSEKAHKLLNEAFPEGWQNQPYLVRVNHNRISASTGHEMFLYLKILFGSQTGEQMYNLIQKYRIKLILKGKIVPVKRNFTK